MHFPPLLITERNYIMLPPIITLKTALMISWTILRWKKQRLRRRAMWPERWKQMALPMMVPLFMMPIRTCAFAFMGTIRTKRRRHRPQSMRWSTISGVKDYRAEMKRIAERIYPDDPEYMLDALACLFPSFGNRITYESDFQTPAELHQALRIASGSKFDLYFSLSLGQFTRNYTQTTKRGLLTTNKG